MDYYERKKETFKVITQLVAEGKHSREDIVFMTIRHTAMGKKFIDTFINDNVERGIFKFRNGIFFSK